MPRLCAQASSGDATNSTAARVSLCFKLQAHPDCVLDPARLLVIPQPCTVKELYARLNGSIHAPPPAAAPPRSPARASYGIPQRRAPAPVVPDGGLINVIVRDQAGTEVHFKIRRTTPMQLVYEAYCRTKSLNIASVKLVFSGDKVMPHDTPATLELEDDDVLDVMIEQIGD